MPFYPRKYTKDLKHTLGLRLEPSLREEAEKAARYSGMNFSQFCRLSLRRNIQLTKQIEEEYVRKNFMNALGKE